MKHHSFHRCPFMLQLVQHTTHQKKIRKVFLQVLYVLTFTSLACLSLQSSVFAQTSILGEAPQHDSLETSTIRAASIDQASIDQADIDQASRTIQSASILESATVELGTVSAIEPSTRQASLDFYNINYANRDDTAMGWTGSQSSCNAGNVSNTFQNQYIHRINYFRAMAGVPSSVQLAQSFNQKSQEAALMMSANNRLSHGPDSSWKCYSEAGKEAAGSANLFLGSAGIDSVDGYIMDPGGGNMHVGHRRWLLHPATKQMGIGSVATSGDYREANAIWVFDSSIWDERPATRDDFVAWPPPGFVPYPIVFARWSFAYPDADFSNASVSMTTNGNNIAVKTEPTVNGFGENTLVWQISSMSDGDLWAKPNADTGYQVSIRNVRIDGANRDFSYTVTIFDPAVEVAVPEIEVNFDAAAPGSYLTVRGDGFSPNQQVPIQLNGTVVENVTADNNGEVALILNTRGASEGDYQISAPMLNSTPDKAAEYSLDSAQPKRVKENIPGVQAASVRNIAPLKQMYMPVVVQ